MELSNIYKSIKYEKESHNWENDANFYLSLTQPIPPFRIIIVVNELHYNLNGSLFILTF